MADADEVTADGLLAETWEPGNRLGYVTSVASALFLAAFVWWIGVVDLRTNALALPASRVLGGVLVGLLLAGGTLAVHAKPTWREHWRTSVRLRATVAVPVAVVIALLFATVPAVLAVGFGVMAVVFVVGRTYLYVAARTPAE